MFKLLCGPDALKSVVLVTSMAEAVTRKKDAGRALSSLFKGYEVSKNKGFPDR